MVNKKLTKEEKERLRRRAEKQKAKKTFESVEAGKQARGDRERPAKAKKASAKPKKASVKPKKTSVTKTTTPERLATVNTSHLVNTNGETLDDMKIFPVNTNNFTSEAKESLKLHVRFMYDAQALRIGFGNRTADPDDYEEVFDERTKKVKRQKKKAPPPNMKKSEEALLILAHTFGEELPQSAPKTLEDKDRAMLQRHALIMQGLEFDTLKAINSKLKDISVYKNFLKGVSGCGPTLSGVLLSEITMSKVVHPELIPDTVERTYYQTNGADFVYFKSTVTETLKSRFEGDEPKTVTKEILCYELEDGTIMQDCCPTVSSLWAYAGMSVDPEAGKAVRRHKGQKSNWNPLLKTKMLGVLASCMLRARRKKDEDGNPIPTKYQQLYANYKHRKESEGWGESKGHRHNAAQRYMVKMFLLDLWKAWRKYEGLPITKSYMEAMLNRNHGDHGGTNLRLIK